MLNIRQLRFFAATLLTLFFLGESYTATPAQNLRSTVTQTTGAGRVEQVFAFTGSDSIKVGGWDNPSPAVLAQITLNLETSSLLIITFSAISATENQTSINSSTQPRIGCMVDSTTPCQPNQVYFLAPIVWDSRSFKWIVHNATKGKHTIGISAEWAPARPTPPTTFIDRTLVIEAAKL